MDNLITVWTSNHHIDIWTFIAVLVTDISFLTSILWSYISSFFSSPPILVASATIFATVFATFYHINFQRLKQLQILRLDHYRKLKELWSEFVSCHSNYTFYANHNHQEMEEILTPKFKENYTRMVEEEQRKHPGEKCHLAYLLNCSSPGFRKSFDNLKSSLSSYGNEIQLSRTLYQKEKEELTKLLDTCTNTLNDTISNMDSYFDHLIDGKETEQGAETIEKMSNCRELHAVLLWLQDRTFDNLWISPRFKKPKQTVAEMRQEIKSYIKLNKRKQEESKSET